MKWIRIIRESASFGFFELVNNLLRSSLSLLGISVGIFLIIFVLSVVDNMEKQIKEGFDELGNDIIYIQKWPWPGFEGEYPWWKYWNRPEPNYKDFKKVNRKVNLAETSCIVASLYSKTVKSGSNSVKNVILTAASYEYVQMYSIVIEEGRYFSQLEAARGVNVAILGYDVAAELFPKGKEPINKKISIRGQKMNVIGVMERKGEDMMGLETDNIVLIPYNFMRKFTDMDSRNVQPFIAVKGTEDVGTPELKEDIRGGDAIHPSIGSTSGR